MRSSLATLIMAALLVAASTAQAQELSIRERVYVGTLGTAFGAKVVDARPVKQADGGLGVAVTFADGTTLTRLRYPDPSGAISQVGRFDGGDTPTVVQARGRQALIVQGPGMRDPLVARHYLGAGWSYLKGGDAPVLVTGYTEGMNTVSSTIADGSVYDAISGAVRAVHRNGPKAGAQDLGDGLYRWDAQELTTSPSPYQEDAPTHSLFHQDANGGTFLLTDEASLAPRMVDYLETLTGEALPHLRRGLESERLITKPIAHPGEAKPEPSRPATPKPPAEGAFKGATNTVNDLFGN